MAKRTFRSISGVGPEDTKWLWWPWMPAGHLTVLAARGGMGKGHVGIALAAAVTTGGFWPGSEDPAPLGRVVWVETEDHLQQTFIPRLIAAGGDRSRVQFHSTPKEFFSLTREFMVENEVRLIVLSPLVSCLPGLNNPNAEMEVREKLDWLLSIAGDETALLALMHTNKKPDLALIERLMGSGAFANFARSVFFVVDEPTEDGSERRRLIHEKHNLSPKADDLTFRMYSTRGPRDQYVRTEWFQPEQNVNADAALDKRAGAPQPISGNRNAAAQWLLRYLTEAGGSAAKKVAVAAGAGQGYKESALERVVSQSDLIGHEWVGRVMHWRVVDPD